MSGSEERRAELQAFTELGPRTEYGGPIRPNDAWSSVGLTAPPRCRFPFRRHRPIPDGRFPTYDVCTRCAARWPRPITAYPVVDRSGPVGETRGA